MWATQGLAKEQQSQGPACISYFSQRIPKGHIRNLALCLTRLTSMVKTHRFESPVKAGKIPSLSAIINLVGITTCQLNRWPLLPHEFFSFLLNFVNQMKHPVEASVVISFK
jgi:hypothetical protein